MRDIELPATLSINAWTGAGTPSGDVTRRTTTWALSRHSAGPGSDETELLPRVRDERDWRDETIGWGLVLPDNEGISTAARSTADDAPAPIHALLAARQPAPVLRYRREGADGYLRRYAPNGSFKDFSLVGSDPGVGPGQLPRYLLLYGGPDVIPWSFQYAANLTHYVGRLSLTGAPLERYVDALLRDWSGMRCDPRAPVVWSVSHGHPDITWLMDQAISRKVYASFGSDPDGDLSRRVGIFDADATVGRLAAALAASSPALVVTTSHGMTGPLDDAAALVARLGLPVDVNRAVLDPDALLAAWAPNGAIWYAHACCSAGSDAPSCYSGLLEPASEVTRVLDGVAAASGRRVAPLPERLLGAEKPLRAFVGHVEPTFDYTLRDPETTQPLAESLRTALYDKLYSRGMRSPVAWALKEVFDDAGDMLALWFAALEAVNRNEPGARKWTLYRQLTGLDRQHTVVLGDPTVALPEITAVDP